MDERGYSTIIDAVLFLAMVSACALILNVAIMGGQRQAATSDASLRSVSSSTLATMETVKVDYFEYRILGDKVDSIAEKCGIDPGAWLYSKTARAVLGRENRHKTVMEIAAEDTASQFTLRCGDRMVKLNPLTGDYDSQAKALVDGSIRQRLDSRYAYNFSLRWLPFAEVSFEGSLTCGGSVPPDAATSSAYVTIPYRTNVTRDSIKTAIMKDLAAIENATAEYGAGGSLEEFRAKIRTALDDCLTNASRPMIKEIMGNTIDEVIPSGDVGNPLTMLATFSDNDSTGAEPLLGNKNLNVEDEISHMIVIYSSGSLDRLADDIVNGTEDGSMGREDRLDHILDWMQSRYNPSRARATLSIWMDMHA
jgi:hypothetical protein